MNGTNGFFWLVSPGAARPVAPQELDLSTCTELQRLELYCPELYESNCKIPALKAAPSEEAPHHPPIKLTLKGEYVDRARRAQEERDAERAISSITIDVPRYHHRV